MWIAWIAKFVEIAYFAYVFCDKDLLMKNLWTSHLGMIWKSLELDKIAGVKVT